MSRESIVTEWAAAIDAFNRGDLSRLGELYADTATHDVASGRIPAVGQQLINLYAKGQIATGWRQELISISAEGEFLAALYRNHFDDGSSVLGVGMARLDADGKVVEMHSLTESGVRSPLEPPAS